MLKSILKKLCYIFILLFVLSFISFLILYEYKNFSSELLDINLESNVSIFSQFMQWLRKIFSGDFGYSYCYRQNIADVIKLPVFNTIYITLTSLFFVIALSIPIGVTTSVGRYSKFDKTIGNLSIIGISIPPFVIAILLIYIFSVKLSIFPYNGIYTAGTTYTGLMALLDNLKHIILPVVVLSIAPIANITRYIRVEMTNVLKKDYVRLARAKGLKEKNVLYTHALKNVMDTIVSMLTWGYSTILATTIVVEHIFSLNGVGNLLIDALKKRDIVIIIVVNIFYIIAAIIGRAFIDIIAMLTDPRIKT